MYVCTCMHYISICTVGERYMTVCLHSLMHLPGCVQNLGPLWSHSCFMFEAANGELLKIFHGTVGIEKQVTLSILIVMSIVH